MLNGLAWLHILLYLLSQQGKKEWRRRGGGLIYQIRAASPELTRFEPKYQNMPWSLQHFFRAMLSTSELEPQIAEHYRIMTFWNECCFLLVSHLALNLILSSKQIFMLKHGIFHNSVTYNSLAQITPLFSFYKAVINTPFIWKSDF